MIKAHAFFALPLIFLSIALASCKHENPEAAQARPSILFIGINRMELRTWDEWINTGFEVEAKHLKDIKSIDNLKRFNAVAICFLPRLQTDGKPTAEQAVFEKLIGEYMAQGGGVAVFCGGGEWSSMSPSVRHFLAPYGASVPEEQVHDKEHITARVEHLNICSTQAIAEQPMTKGIRSINYPGEASRADCIKTMQPIVIKDTEKWKVAVYGEKTAKSSEGLNPGATAKLKDEAASYAQSPVIAAFREVGKGRLFVFPVNVAFSITSPAFFGNICWGQEKNADGPQNKKFIMQAMKWAAEPTLESKIFGGYQTDRKVKFDEAAILNKTELSEINWEKAKVFPARQYELGKLKGLIGLQSILSGGKNSIKDLCIIAKKEGLDFAGFTENLESLDPEKWEKLKAECIKESDEKFLAIPGILAKDKIGNQYFALGYPSFPEAPALTADGKRIDNVYQFYAKYFSMRMLSFTLSASNPSPWYELRQCSGMAFCNSTAENEKEFLRAYIASSAEIDNYIPFSFTTARDEKEIHDAAESELLNIFTGKNITELKDYISGKGILSDKNNCYWENPHLWYLSAGPELLYNGGINIGHLNTYEEKQNLYKYGFKLDNLQKGDHIKLYDGQDVIREWIAEKSDFSTSATWPHQQTSVFTITIERNGKNIFIGSPIYTSAGSRFMQCADRQNTLPFCYVPDKNGNWFVSGLPVGPHYRTWSPDTLLSGNFKIWMTGAIGIEQQPIMYASFRTTPEIPVQGKEIIYGHSLVSWTYPLLSCPGIIITRELTNRFYPGNGAHERGDCMPVKKTEALKTFNLIQRRYGLYGMLEEMNAQLVESEIVALKDLTLSSDQVKVSGFNMADVTGCFLEIYSDGKTVNTPLDKVFTWHGKLQPGDYIGCYPFGLPKGGAQYAIEGELSAQVNADGKNLNVSIFLTVPKAWKKGESFKFKMLYSTGASKPIESSSNYKALVDFLGLKDHNFPAIKKIRNGTLAGNICIPTINATQDSTLSIETIQMPSPLALPLRIHGYNPKWQLAYTLDSSKKWRYCGQLNEDSYMHLYTSTKAFSVKMGHPVTTDNPDIEIKLDDPNGEQSVFEIYNPSGKAVEATLKTNPDFLPGKPIKIRLEAFESRKLDMTQTQNPRGQ